MNKHLIVIVVLLSLSGLCLADDQVISQYLVNNLNVNAQTSAIVQGIQQNTPSKIIINYAGAMYFLANEVRAGIAEQSSVAIEMNALNPYYTYSTGQITVTLIDDTPQSQAKIPEASESGGFFDYTNQKNNFFSYE